MVSHDGRYFEWLTFQPYLLLDSFCEIQLLKGCISMTTIISAVHGTVFHYSLLFSSILWKFLTLLISRLISNISFIQLSSLLSGYPVCVFSLCVFCLCVFSVCFLSVFSVCVFSVCVFCVFSLCVFSLCFLCVFCLCFLSVFSVYVFSLCVFCLCFLSGFAFYRTTKNDTFLSINFDIILLWSGLADQLFFANINTIKGWWSANSQLI